MGNGAELVEDVVHFLYIPACPLVCLVANKKVTIEGRGAYYGGRQPTFVNFPAFIGNRDHSWANSLPDHMCPDNGVQVLTFSSSDL